MLNGPGSRRTSGRPSGNSALSCMLGKAGKLLRDFNGIAICNRNRIRNRIPIAILISIYLHCEWPALEWRVHKPNLVSSSSQTLIHARVLDEERAILSATHVEPPPILESAVAPLAGNRDLGLELS